MELGVAKMLVGKGYHVFATYIGPKFTEKIENFEAINCDQTNREEVYKFINYVKSKTDHMDCIHCNAGMSIRKRFTEYEDKDWDAMMEVAVNSHYIMIREFFPIIPNGSRILFTGSQMGLNPHAMVLAYGVTKSAVHALCKNLVKEFEGTDTTVNAVVPGFVETPWQKEKPEEIKQNIYKKTAIHRFATIDEIVKAFEFCIDNPFVKSKLALMSFEETNHPSFGHIKLEPLDTSDRIKLFYSLMRLYKVSNVSESDVKWFVERLLLSPIQIVKAVEKLSVYPVSTVKRDIRELIDWGDKQINSFVSKFFGNEETKHLLIISMMLREGGV